MKETFGISEGLTGLAATLFAIFAILGGIKSISRVTQILVPCMAVFYMAGALAVIIMNLENLPGGIAAIVTMAFSPRAAAGGMGARWSYQHSRHCAGVYPGAYFPTRPVLAQQG